jgi:hypothetical protein
MTKQKIQLPYADLKFAGQEWARRHNTAVTEFQLPILRMITAWAQYAEDHKAEFDAPIGEDQLTGQEYWRTPRSIVAESASLLWYREPGLRHVG